MPTVRDEGRTPAGVAQLRLGIGFNDGERDDVIARLSKLDRRLRRFDAEAVNIELSVKARDTNEQQVMLEAKIAGFDRFLAISRQPLLKDALNDVRDDIWRQIDDAFDKRTAGRRPRQGVPGETV